MHFAIPDVQELKDSTSIYIGYNVHVNGVYHSTVRYRQLHFLHDQLRKEFNADLLPPFPPKKLLPLSVVQLEERRHNLEKYIQLVSQDKISACELFTRFLCAAQLNSHEDQLRTEVEITIALMNGQKIVLKVSNVDRTSDVIEKLCSQLEVPVYLNQLYGLYAVEKLPDGDISLLRKLHDFEAPVIAFKELKPSQSIVLRKSYWDSYYDESLIADKVSQNLLYIQTAADIERKWVDVDTKTSQQLANCQAKGSKVEYLKLAKTLKHYGRVQLGSCVSDYPKPGTKATVSAANRELILNLLHPPQREFIFRVTRMRCWRITILHQDEPQSGSSAERNPSKESKLPRLELSFEYLLAKDQLHWVTLVSSQAILFSVCLQQMVQELLHKQQERSGPEENHHNIEQKTLCSDERRNSWCFMKQDGSLEPLVCRSHSTGNGYVSFHNGVTRTPSNNGHTINRISEKLSNLSLRLTGRPHSNGHHGSPVVENGAFDGIGDDDL